MRSITEERLARQLIREEIKRCIIYEGLIFSYSPAFIFTSLKGMGYSDIFYNKHRKVFSINFALGSDNESRYRDLDHFLDNVCGWFHGSSISNKNVLPNKTSFIDIISGNVFLQYEAKFNIRVEKLPGKIYHLTTEEKLKKILKVGLTPKSSILLLNYRDRIYFSLNYDSLINFSKQKSSITNKNDFIILEVETSKINHGTRFFEDPNFLNGVYTLENIPPYAIKPFIKIKVDGELVDKVFI